MSKGLLYLFVIMNMIACATTKNENMTKNTINKIVQEYVEKTTKSEDVELMKKILQDNISDWIVEYSNMGFYKEENYSISDIMIFGKDKDKVLLLVSALLIDSDDGEVKLLAGKLNDNDTWDFRFTGMPSFYYEYNEELRKGEKFTDQEIISRTIDKMIEDGLVTFYDEVSQDYIKNKWF